MNEKRRQSLSKLLIAGLLLLTGNPLFAGDGEPKHKLVIQVSTDDVRTQNIAMNNAVNLIKAVGQDEVIVEIVAYGPGLTMLTDASSASSRVPNLALQGITFSACGTTKAKMEKKSGETVMLVEGVRIVPAGVLRIIELQEQGYSYVRP